MIARGLGDDRAGRPDLGGLDELVVGHGGTDPELVARTFDTAQLGDPRHVDEHGRAR